MALRANVGFQAVFTKLLRDMNGEIYDVSRFQIQETGLEGYIHQQLVHLGSYQYMQLMGVTLPKRAPKYGVYIAINRELAGLFGVKYQVSNGAVGGFRRVFLHVGAHTFVKLLSVFGFIHVNEIHHDDTTHIS